MHPISEINYQEVLPRDMKLELGRQCPLTALFQMRVVNHDALSTVDDPNLGSHVYSESIYYPILEKCAEKMLDELPLSAEESLKWHSLKNLATLRLSLVNRDTRVIWDKLKGYGAQCINPTSLRDIVKAFRDWLWVHKRNVAANLAHLICEGHNLTFLPNEICEFEKLKVLRLHNNSILAVPDRINKLVNLTELNLGYNAISVIPLELYQLPRLKSLNLAGNRFTVVPQGIGNLPLLHLWLNDNRITEYPDDMVNLRKLKLLWTDEDQEIQIPDHLYYVFQQRGVLGSY